MIGFVIGKEIEFKTNWQLLENENINNGSAFAENNKQTKWLL